MKYFGILSFFLFFTFNLSSQNFKGQITDKANEPLHGGTVYIKEINHGLVCNENGQYQTTLPTGSYLVEFKCLGFERIERRVQILPNETTIVNISLEEKPFDLKEVTVSNTEDPAYEIMRKAIAKAPYYANTVKGYTADTYIKVNMELFKISKLLDRMIQKSEGMKASELRNQMFVQETFNEIEYNAPDKYKQTVIAFSSSIPDNFDSKEAISIMNGSLYTSKLGQFISPLNENAFSYYKFRYEGYSEEDGTTINKIKVSPKVKDPILFEGYIYIVDGTWHINLAELSSHDLGDNRTYTITYQKIAEDVYLPVSYFVASNLDFLGISGALNYYASLKYKHVDVNKDAMKIIAEKKNTKRNFEIKTDSLYTTLSDSLAQNRDSSYWKQIRVIPLDEREAISFVRKDSIQQRIDSVREKHKPSRFSFGNLLMGGQTGSDSSKVRVRYDGLLRILPEYNFVDGAWIGQKFTITSKLNEKQKLRISPYLYYATARERFIGGTNIDLDYAPMKLGSLSLSAGSTSTDFNPLGAARLDNMYSSLSKGKNLSYFYQKDFVAVQNSIDLANGLKLNTGFEIAKRRGLSNNTDFVIWGARRNIRPNIYSDDSFDKTSYNVGLEYTPYAYYSIKKGVKRYENYASPTFLIDYEEGFSSWQTNNSKFRKIKAGINQSLALSYFSRINYSAEAGTFIGNNDRIHFADYHHFDAVNTFLTCKNPFDSYLMLNSYEYSTNRHWIDTRINYTSKYILLKRIPFFQGQPFMETLHLKSLYTPDNKFYTEAGYSINLTRLISFGAFTSFNNVKYTKFDVRLSIGIDAFRSIIY